MRHAVIALAALLASGCAAPYFVGQSGRVTPKGTFQAQLGSGYNLSSSAIDVVRDGRDAAKTLAKYDCSAGAASCYREADLKPIVDAGLRLALVSPLNPYSELSARWGFWDGFDVGAHLGSGTQRLDVGWQFAGPRDGSPGWASTAILGVNKHDSGLIGDIVETIGGDMSRMDYDLVVVSGREFQYGNVYFGGRYMLTRWTLELVPDVPILYDSGEVQSTFLGTDDSGYLHNVGAILGGSVGYGHVFVGGEVDVTYFNGSARILFDRHRLEGVAVTPTAYVTVKF